MHKAQSRSCCSPLAFLSLPQTLKCDMVLVVGDERLYSQLSGELKRTAPSVQVLDVAAWVAPSLLGASMPLLP